VAPPAACTAPPTRSGSRRAISKRIQSLERRTGATLLKRGRRGVATTEAGRALYPEAKQARTALERAARAIGRDGAGLRLAASHTVGEFLLPGWLAASRSGEPLPIEMDVINSPGVIGEVRDGRADIGFVEGNSSLAGLDVQVLMRDELAVIVSADHRWARRTAIGSRELTREPYLVRERDSGTRAEAETGTLRALPVRGVDLSRELRAIRRHGEPLPDPARRLRAWLLMQR
jgi:DNA-binding transcriptional LysR family regulator